MEQYLNKGIKEIIDQFPEVEKILDEYGIGCGPCSVGICELKDIVDIHNLPAEQEQELMQKIAATIYPGQDVQPFESKKKKSTVKEKKKFSPPLKKLIDELFSKFDEVDQKMGFSPDKYEAFVQKLEIQFY
jgi:hypothetical protein